MAIKDSETFPFYADETEQKSENGNSCFDPLFLPVYRSQIESLVAERVSTQKSFEAEKAAREKDVFANLFPF